MADSSQKFIARNRAPRVQIEYDVELYGAEKKVQLPFVMGVMSDLSGRSEEPQPSLEDSKFLEIDVDIFDSRMRAMRPRAAFAVPNTLTGEGNLTVDITFESMKDFSPAAIAAKVGPLRKLLEARTQLSNLMTYMDGKSGAEDLILKMMKDPDILRALSPAGSDAPDHETALSALRDAAPREVVEGDEIGGVLDALREAAPDDVEGGDGTESVLDSLRQAAPGAVETEDTTSAALEALRNGAPGELAEEDDTADVLDALRDAAPEAAEETDSVDAVLEDLRSAVVAEPDFEDASEAALETLRDAVPEVVLEADDSADVLDALRNVAPEEVVETDSVDAALEGLKSSVVAEPEFEDASEAALDTLRDAAPEDVAKEEDTADVLEALRDAAPVEQPETDSVDDVLDGLLEADAGDGEVDEAPEVLGDSGDGEAAVDPGETDAALDDLLATNKDSTSDDLDDLLASDAGVDGDGCDVLADLDALLGDDSGDDAPDTEIATAPDNSEADDPELDDVLADADKPAPQQDGAPESDDLDDLLNMVAGEDGDAAGTAATEPPDELDAVLAADTAPAAASGAQAGLSFGTLSTPRPDRETSPGDPFRLAIFGDFTGRAARGVVEIGEALANRRPIRLDIDNVEDVIEGFATTLLLPIGKDGAGIEVKLGGLDDLHPDELYENVEVFSELSGLRQRLQMGSMAPAAVAELQGWGEEFGALNLGSRRTSAGSAVPADKPISAFADLIGDVEGRLTQPSPVSDLIARIVAPHVVAAESAETTAMIAAVDASLSHAMRLILHNPEFQSVESQWRSIDLLARRIETDASLKLVLYDISAEEIAADIAANDDLSESGLFQLLTDSLEERGEVGFSALFGLYTFEETPPHAELLARISRVAAHVNAPFFTAISPEFLKTRKDDRHPLVKEAWEKLRDMPEARHLGVASPKFMLRRQYGARSEPIDAFEFEEFTLSEGLRGMLWANPVVLVAILLAASRKKGGRAMQLGDIMSLGDIPFHFMTDEHGDQMALPCTERNLTTAKMADVVTRGLMPVLSIRGRDEIRLGSFQAVGRGEILGPWSGDAETPPPAPVPASEPKTVSEPEPEQTPQTEMEIPVEEPDTEPESGDDDLDALLASFADDEPDTENDDMDAELAALLEDL